ncbi:Gfo/Idh/MocA family oxidoreductase (plasmid) [Aggregatilineales bacterium SYSU G02658]
MIRVGIMSFAHLHAEAYVHNLRANPLVDLVGFADDDAERGHRFAEQYNLSFFDTYEELLEQNLDAVVICSENSRHLEMAQLAAQKGVHILCEKPLATTVSDAEQIVQVCRSAGVNLMTAFPMRFSAPLLEVKRFLEADGLGRVYACNSTNQGECPKHHRAWFVDPVLAGGGAVSDHVVHLADVLAWYLDDAVTEVYAVANRILYADEAEVETGGLVMLTYAQGTFATIDCSWSKPPYYPTWGGLALDLIGEKGVVTANAFKQVMTVYQHTRQRPIYTYWGSDANQAMIDEFVASIQDKRQPKVTGEDGLRAVRIVEAAYRSIETGQPVPLEG